MAQPPAFQQYARDFITETAACTLDEKGAYALLKCWTWMNGPVPIDRMPVILGVPGARARKLWDAIKQLFHETPTGWVIDDLEAQREGQWSFLQSQKDKASKGGLARAVKLAQERSRGSAPHVPTATAGAVAGEVPGVLPEPCPKSAPALCILQDQTQDQKDQPPAALSLVQIPVENRATSRVDENPKVLEKLAHVVLDELAGGAFIVEDLLEVFKKRAARAGLRYDGDRTRKALESAQAQRQMGRRG